MIISKTNLGSSGVFKSSLHKQQKYVFKHNVYLFVWKCRAIFATCNFVPKSNTIDSCSQYTSLPFQDISAIYTVPSLHVYQTPIHCFQQISTLYIVFSEYHPFILFPAKYYLSTHFPTYINPLHGSQSISTLLTMFPAKIIPLHCSQPK